MSISTSHYEDFQSINNDNIPKSNKLEVVNRDAKLNENKSKKDD